ncbi:MAG TPA: hypothetical protein VGB55_00865, partial [Tepidisphaeraceae bacterium]
MRSANSASHRATLLNAATALTVVAGSAVAGPPKFGEYAQLQTPTGGKFGNFHGTQSMSTAGLAGRSYFSNASSSKAIRWGFDGTPTVLGAVEGAVVTESFAIGINASGESAGYTGGPYENLQAARWDASGKGTLLGLLPDANPFNNKAFGINDAGYAVGHQRINEVGVPVRWDAKGTPTQLASIGNAIGGGARTINNENVVAGTLTYEINGFIRDLAVRWDSEGNAKFLGEVEGLEYESTDIYGINAAGAVVGSIDIGSDDRAIRWDADGQAALLGDLPGLTTNRSGAYGISENGYAVGLIVSPTVFGGTAVLWDVDGTAVPLTDLLEDEHTWNLIAAAAILDVGDETRVLAFGQRDGGDYHWYVFSTASV